MVVAWTEDVPGAVTQGRTLEEAEENLKDAIALMLIRRSRRGLIQAGDGVDFTRTSRAGGIFSTVARWRVGSPGRIAA